MTIFSHAFAYISATMFQAKDAREEKGATAVEYGLLVALIAAVIIGAVLLLGGNVLDGFTDVNEKLDAPAGGTPSADADA